MNEEALELLKRVAKDVADIKAALAASVGASAASLGIAAKAGGGSAVGGVASDRELDGQYGDPVIRKDPPRWTGESYVGCTFSEASAEYLDCYAEFKEWQAQKDESSGAKDSKGRSKAGWSIKDARLARGWAARRRGGWKPAGGGNGKQQFSDDDYDAGGDEAQW